MSPAAAIDPGQFSTFGELLKYLRQRAGLTQRELSIAVGYTESHISRLEHDQRAPDAAVLAARFVPALGLTVEREWVARLLELAGSPRALPAAVEPPPAPALPPPNNLPASLTSFIGRERELAEIQARLADPASRLLTLTGAGGSGKTRLALRAAGDSFAAFPDGVWFVDLAPVTGPENLTPALLSALGLLDDPQRTPLTMVASFLKHRSALLIIDNCEHLVVACAEIAQSLLQSCPRLRLLTTSREVLGVAGELVFHVPTLPTPDPARLPGLNDLAQFEAIRLFVERARTAFAGFGLTPANAQAVAEVCWQLDGIPLALELAAARVHTLRVEQIAARLAAYGRFRLLTGGSRAAQPRQQTLLAAIEWSHALLSEPERVLFRRLSIFAGGWTLEAAEQVAGDGSQRSEVGRQKPSDFRLPTSDVLDPLTQLVNKSLVYAERQPGGEARYRTLETIRQYAREQLWAAGEGDTTQQRHLAYYVALAERAGPELRGPEQVQWLDLLEAEHDNIRAALTLSVESDVVAGLRLAGALEWFWWIREYKQEGAAWLERLLTIEAQACGESRSVHGKLVRGRALNVRGRLAEMLHYGEIARQTLQESVELHRSLGPLGRQGLGYALWLSSEASEAGNALVAESYSLFREVGDKFGMAEALALLSAFSWRARGDFDGARNLADQNLALRREIGDEDGLASGLVYLAQIFGDNGDDAQAAEAEAEALRLFRKLKNKWGVVWSLSALADTLWSLGDYDQARQHFEEAAGRVRDLGEQLEVATATFGLGNLALCQGDYEQAARRFATTLAEAREVGSQWTVLEALLHLGEAAIGLGDFAAAAQYFQEVLEREGQVEVNLRFFRARALLGLGRVAWAQGDPASACVRLLDALRRLRGSGFLSAINNSLEALAIANVLLQKAGPASRLFGVTHKAQEATRYRHSPAQRSDRAQALAEARALLGETAFAEAFAEGQGMTLEEAIEYALTLEPS